MTIFDALKLSSNFDSCKKYFDEHKVDIAKATCSFWIFNNLFQRVATLLPLHSGSILPLKFGFGFISYSLASSLSYLCVDLKLEEIKNPRLLKSKYNNHNVEKDFLRKYMIGLGIFCLLERKLFETTLPSNLLNIGVFARKNGSILATSDVATEAQRKLIQQFGNRFGCHHCGNRQMFARVKTFIADHQPPTKFVEQFSTTFYSKLTNTKVNFKYIASILLKLKLKL